MDELKKCPFCGAEAVIHTFKAAGENFHRYRAKCTECWCQTDWESETPEDVIAKWNRRVEKK